MQQSPAAAPSYVVVTANSILVTPPFVPGATEVVGWVIVDDVMHRSSCVPGQTMVFPKPPGSSARLTLNYSDGIIVTLDIPM